MQNYDYSRLHSSLVGVIQEAQTKIGYDRHAITLYYPAASLAHMLGTKEDADTVEQALSSFSAFAQPTLGAVEVVRDDERFCIYVPAEGAEYVHEKVPDSGFLKAFLAVVSGLEVSLDDILAVSIASRMRSSARKSRAAMSSTTSFTSKTASRTATATASSSKRTAVRPTTVSFARITRRSASDGPENHRSVHRGRGSRARSARPCVEQTQSLADGARAAPRLPAAPAVLGARKGGL